MWFRRENKRARWSKEQLIPLPRDVGTGKSVVVSDVNRDGTNDLIFSCEHADGARSGLRWLNRVSDEWVSQEIGGPEGIKFDQILLYDVDQDGDDDVLCCEERDQLGVIWYENPTTQ